MSYTRRSALRTMAAIATLSALAPLARAAAESRRIGVVGAGSLGGTVGRLWVRAGHQVRFSSLEPERLRQMTRELGSRASVGTALEAVEFGSVLLFAVPYEALPQLGRELAPSLRGKIVLDACNGGADLMREAKLDGNAELSARLLPGTRLVRAFSAVDATAIAASADRRDGKLGVPIAGDDAEAVKVAAQLVRDVGSVPVIVGNLASARSFQRGAPGFRVNSTAGDLRRALGMPEAAGEQR